MQVRCWQRFALGVRDVDARKELHVQSFGENSILMWPWPISCSPGMNTGKQSFGFIGPNPLLGAFECRPVCVCMVLIIISMFLFPHL